LTVSAGLHGQPTTVEFYFCNWECVRAYVPKNRGDLT
jgi:hypothetical protein